MKENKGVLNINVKSWLCKIKFVNLNKMKVPNIYAALFAEIVTLAMGAKLCLKGPDAEGNYE